MISKKLTITITKMILITRISLAATFIDLLTLKIQSFMLFSTMALITVRTAHDKGFLSDTFRGAGTG